MSPWKGTISKGMFISHVSHFQEICWFRGEYLVVSTETKNKHLDIQTPQLRRYDVPPQKNIPKNHRNSRCMTGCLEISTATSQTFWKGCEIHVGILIQGMLGHLQTYLPFLQSFSQVGRRRWRGRGKIGNLQGQAISRGQLRKLLTVTSSSSVSGIMMSWWPTGLWSHLWKGIST